MKQKQSKKLDNWLSIQKSLITRSCELCFDIFNNRWCDSLVWLLGRMGDIPKHKTRRIRARYYGRWRTTTSISCINEPYIFWKYNCKRNVIYKHMSSLLESWIMSLPEAWGLLMRPKRGLNISTYTNLAPGNVAPRLSMSADNCWLNIAAAWFEKSSHTTLSKALAPGKQPSGNVPITANFLAPRSYKLFKKKKRKQ